MKPVNISALEKKLDYTFHNRQLLLEALRHSSFVNEQSDPDLRDNERLEFLGDAVLNLVVGHMLMLRYPGLKEGELSRIRSALVNESTLAHISRDLQLGKYLLFGKGELSTKGNEKRSILADAFEALTAAVFLDAGYQTVYRTISGRFKALLDTGYRLNLNFDFKSRLQEQVQESHKTIPRYELIEACGPDHDKIFRVQVCVNKFSAAAEGKTKKAAEQAAARKMLEQLDQQPV